MRLPDSLSALVDHGILDEVVRPLMSGKEAQVYLVISGGAERVAKVYKEAENRTFKHRSDYTEGRRVRNSRDQRAMEKRSRHGRAQDEQAWRSAEVDIIYRLRDAGVRVPQPFHFIDGVLIMELVTDALGAPAPRLGDLTYTPEEAQAIFDRLITEVTRMLCAGVVHGDLSDFNVLMAADGPVIIDFPQAINAASNQNARRILERDVANLQRFLSRFSAEAKVLPYAQELWELYQRNALTPDTRLTGRVRAPAAVVKPDAVMSLVRDAARDERKRREFRGLNMRGMEPEHTQDGRREPAANARAESRRDAPAREQQRAPAQYEANGHRDAPARQHTNAPARQHTDAPARQHTNAPARQHTNAPARPDANGPRNAPARPDPRAAPHARQNAHAPTEHARPDTGQRGEFAARPAFREDARQPPARQDFRREDARQPPARQDFRREDARQPPARQDFRREDARQPPARQDFRREDARQPPARQDFRREDARQSPARPQSARQGGFRAEVTHRNEPRSQSEHERHGQTSQATEPRSFGSKHDKPVRRDS